jgi:hypothetical protein
VPFLLASKLAATAVLNLVQEGMGWRSQLYELPLAYQRMRRTIAVGVLLGAT